MQFEKRASAWLPGSWAAPVFLFLSLLVAPAGATSTEQACASTVRFVVEPKVPIDADLKGKLILRPVEGEGESLIVETRVGTPVTAQLPCSTRWEATAAFPETWGPRTTILASASGGILTSHISLWPLGRISGSMKLAQKGERFPEKASITTLAPRLPSQRSAPKGLLDCLIDDKGRLQCPSLPATTFDLVLSAEGYIPRYYWGIEILPGKTTHLGDVELKRGSSVAGWVVVDEGGIDAGCKASLSPLLGPGSGALIAEKVRGTTVEVPVRKDGFFQFAGVPPGSYSIEVRQAGFAAASFHPIEVWPNSETYLRQPITLKRPLQLELAISPGLDWLGRPWKVAVFRASDATGRFDSTIFNGFADDQGLLSIPGQMPGRFRVTISDGLDNRLASQDLKVTEPADAHQEIRLEILTVEGTLSLGREALAATLWFGGRHGESAVKMESDPDGKFHGILPRVGWWKVEIASSEPKLSTQTKVKVEADGQDRATVEINLPATRIFGKVVDDNLRPMRSALVSLSFDDGNMVVSTDDSGAFDLRGIPEGMAYAAATLHTAQATWTSDRIALFVRSDEEIGPVELRMRKNKRLTGKVLSGRGPVPGAGIVVLPLFPTLIFGDAVRTELDGSFTAQVPATTETAAVIVSPPGHALKAFPVRVGESPQPLNVGEESGDLEILLPKKPEDAERDEISLWVFQDGLPIPNDVLHGWVAGHGKEVGLAEGTKLTFPELAPGEYRVCLAVQAVLAAWQASGWTAPLATCATGHLTAGGTLQLDLSAD